MVGKKRLLLAAGTIASVGAVIALATGVTFGLFSATSTSTSNSFAAGNVTLTSGPNTTCTITSIVPGDSNPAACTLEATYTGGVAAVFALDLSITSQTPGSGPNTYVEGSDTGTAPTNAPGLFDGTATGLQLTLTDNNGNTYLYNGHDWKDQSGATQNLFSNQGYDLLAGDTSASPITWTLGWSLPLNAGNGYQNAATTIRMQAHAVQQQNNDPYSLGTPCVTGQQCLSQAGFGWS